MTSKQGLSGTKVAINSSASNLEWLDLTTQLLYFFFSLMPVVLALYLLSQTGDVRAQIGLAKGENLRSLASGLALTAVVGIPGLGLYFGARALGISAQIVTNDLNAYWWTIPVLLLSALGAAVLEEFLVIGYLFDRLKKLGRSIWASIFISAGLRGSYHLYQGFGGFIGNFAMGVLFGYFYKRYGKLKPLVIAHFMLDAISFVGYSFVKQYLPL